MRHTTLLDAETSETVLEESKNGKRDTILLDVEVSEKALEENKPKKWAACRSENKPTVKFITLQDETYLLPWQHLLQVKGDSGAIYASFVTCNVTLKGQRLKTILTLLETFKLDFMEQSERTEQFEDDGKEPIVFEMTIKPVGSKG